MVESTPTIAGYGLLRHRMAAQDAKRIVQGIAVFALLCASGCSTPQPDSSQSMPAAGAPAHEPPSPPPAAPAGGVPARRGLDGTLVITLDDAILLAMENNRSLRVERFNPLIRGTAEAAARAAFDPSLSLGALASRVRPPEEMTSASDIDAVGAELGGSIFLPTGTRLAAGLEIERSSKGTNNAFYTSRAGVSVTQALLRGAGTGPNLAELRQARLDTHISEFELRGTAESLAARVEATYWDYAVALRRVAIVEESLRLAEQQREETLHRIRVGGLPETEAAAAAAEVALREEALINSRSRVETLRVRLLRLVMPEMLGASGALVNAASEPPAPEDELGPIEEHIALALRMRPDLNQARLLAQRGDIELVRTANGLLPKLDLFVQLGKTGYADSFNRSFNELDGDAYDAAMGLAFEWPVGDRAAAARHRRAAFAREQLDESIRNMEDLAREDVQTAYIEVHRARQQMDATTATRALQSEKLRAETAKFRVGKSTALLVAQAQRDLVTAQNAEVEAVAAHLKALTELYRLEGSFLERRGIAAPGRPAM